MYPLTPKSIGFVPDLYPTKVPNTSPLGLTMSEKSGRQTDTHTHTQTDGRDQKLYSCPLRWGNYKKVRNKVGFGVGGTLPAWVGRGGGHLNKGVFLQKCTTGAMARDPCLYTINIGRFYVPVNSPLPRPPVGLPCLRQ